MKLISTEHGQSFQPFIAEEVRPPSGLYLPDVIRAITQRYAFVQAPTDLATVAREGAKYKEGRFIAAGGRTIAIKDLGFFNDGILVVAWNTNDSDAVLNDIIAWASDIFQLRERRTILPKRYASSVVVELDASINGAITIFNEFSAAVSSAINDVYGWDYGVDAARIHFMVDPERVPPNTMLNFTIEQRAGLPFSANRYFSAASVPTSTHIELLEGFEHGLMGKRT